MLNRRFWRAMFIAALLGAPVVVLAQDDQASGLDALASTTPRDIPDSGDGNVAVAPDLDEAAPANAFRAELLPSLEAGQNPGPLTNGGTNQATWTKVSDPEGSTKYSVNKVLATPWDAKIGADISVAAAPVPSYEPRPLPSTTSQGGNGNAWANVTIPYFATVEVHAEPANDYDKVGTKFERTVTLGKSLSLTVKSTFNFTDLRSPQAVTPVSALASSAPSSVFDADKSFQLNILSSGTTLSAGSTTVTGDPVTHNRLSAAQKIYGPLTVTGSINDVGQATSSKSISAGLNFSW